MENMMESKFFLDASSIYSAVAKFSGNAEPNYVNFYSYALNTKNEKLVQAILLISEQDFKLWSTLKVQLERHYFGKVPVKLTSASEISLKSNAISTHA